MTTAPDEATTKAGDDRDLLQEMSREFREWSKCVQARIDNMGGTGGFPHAGTPNWLPSGWHEHSQFSHTRFGRRYLLAIWLVRRETGGWVLVSHTESSTPRTMVHFQAATLHGLYEAYRVQDDKEAITRWLSRVLASYYDPTDETEAATQIIVALGGEATLEPRAALP